MKQRFFFFASLLALVALTGCVGGGRGGSGNESLNQQVARHEQQIQGLLSQVGQVEQVLPGQAEMWSQMQTMRQELNTVQGRLDDIHFQTSGEGGGELAALKDKVARIEALVRQIASQLAISTSSLDVAAPAPQYREESAGGTSPGYAAQPYTARPPAPAADPGPSPAVSTQGGDTATNLYDSGIKAFDQRRYKDAVIIFKDFVSTYPSHKLAGNAQFWEGESHYQVKDYARAALAYQEVIAKYPASPKLQSSMFKQGVSLYHAGKKDAAKQRLNELISKYPKSPEATRAKDFMKKNK